MKSTTLKTLLILSASCFAAGSSLANQLNNKEDIASDNIAIQKNGPEPINGIIKKMILVASDVVSVETDAYENNDYTESFQLAQAEETNLVDQYFERRRNKKNTLDDDVNPLYWEKVRENYLKQLDDSNKKLEEINEKSEEEELSVKDDSDSKVVEADEGVEIIMKRRPNENYRNQKLPDIISKKEYNKYNKHLPVAIYEEDYKNILLRSILVQDIDVMRALIERMGTTEVRDENGNTPLLYATISGNSTPLKVLIGMGASVNAQNNEGISPLYVAIKDRNFELAQYLIKSGAKVDLKTENGKNLLMLAAENNDARMVNQLLDMGVNVNQKMEDGNTALHFAAMKNSSLVSDILITKGAKFDTRNHRGYTPIMIASAYGSTETVSLLINSGADLRTTDALGQDAYLLAMNNNHHNIVSMIEQERANFLNYEPEIRVSPIDESLTTAPIPLAKPMEELAPVEIMDNDLPTLKVQPPEDLPTDIIEEDPNAPFEMPLPVFDKEEIDKM